MSLGRVVRQQPCLGVCGVGWALAAVPGAAVFGPGARWREGSTGDQGDWPLDGT